MSFNRFRGGKQDQHPQETHPRVYIDDFILQDHPRFAGPLDTVTYAAPAISFPMDLNDQLGDCVPTGCDHVQMAIEFSRNGSCASWGDSLVQQVYSEVGGYVAGDPSTDNGCVIQDMLSFWRKNSIGGVQISWFAALRSWKRANRVRAMQLAGPLVTGYQLPESAEQQFPSPWVPVPGSAIAGGHCAPQMGELLVTDECQLCSWAAIVRANKAFLMQYQDEAWVIGYPGYDPSGLAESALNDAVAALTGEINPLGLKTTIAIGS